MTTGLSRAWTSLQGLSVGDAFGERFFGLPGQVYHRIAQRQLPQAPWNWTDDTAMACCIVRTLQHCSVIEQDPLAQFLVTEYLLRPARGYGRGACEVLNEISHGRPWRLAAQSLFGGDGSCGNGAAMRVAPIGAYFCDDLEQVVMQARLSAEVTHLHPEGVAGAVAVAVAAACAWRDCTVSEMQALTLQLTPPGQVRLGIERAIRLSLETSVSQAVADLGNGSEVLAQDTVPFTLWCAARHWDDFVEGMWSTVSGLGDRDTTCAIVAGILAGRAQIPAHWLAAREPLPMGIPGCLPPAPGNRDQ